MSKATKQHQLIGPKSARTWVGILGLALLSAVVASGAYAQPAPAEKPAAEAAEAKTTTTEAPPAKPATTEATHGRPANKPYYIEFRARNAQTYGHTFSIYGRVNENGKIATSAVAGLHPATESALPWMVGHFVVVPSETGASDGDKDDQYVLARFHVALSADEFKKVVGYVKELQAKSPMWHAVLYNCNAFVGDIAKFMGMETPASTLLMPADYINGLKKLNMKRTGIIGTPVEVMSAERLREAALRAQGKKVAAQPEGAAKPSDQKPKKQADNKPAKPAQAATGSAAANPNSPNLASGVR